MSRRFSAPLGKRVQIKRFRTFARNRQNGFAALGNCFIKTSLRGRGRSYRHDLTGRPGTVAKHGPDAQSRRACRSGVGIRRFGASGNRLPATARLNIITATTFGGHIPYTIRWRHCLSYGHPDRRMYPMPMTQEPPEITAPGASCFTRRPWEMLAPSDRQDCKMGSDELASNGSAETPKNQRKRPRPDGRRSSARLKFPSVS
jgi:hypothetical protein